MKKLLLSFFISGMCLASGKLSFENQFFMPSHKVGPVLGLAVYEFLPLNLAYNGWHGGGLNYESNWWFFSKNDIEMKLSDDITLGAGVGYRVNPHNESDIHVALSYQLW